MSASPKVSLRGIEGKYGEQLFGKGNRWLVDPSPGSSLLLWPVQVDDLLHYARKRAGRNLSLSEWQQYFPYEPYRPSFLDLPCPRYDKAFKAIARNLTPDEWEEYYPGEPYRKLFDDSDRVIGERRDAQ